MGVALQQLEGSHGDVCGVHETEVQFADPAYLGTRIIQGSPPNYGSGALSPSDFGQDDPHRNDPGYFLANPELVTMVNTRAGVVVLRSDYTLVLMEIRANRLSRSGYMVMPRMHISFRDLAANASFVAPPQLVYEPISNYLYVLYPTLVLGGNLDDMVMHGT